MDQDTVLVQWKPGSCRIILNRPEVLNSLDLPMVAKIRETLVLASRDPGIRAVLFTGGGDRAFCAGGDVVAMAREVRENRPDRAERFLSEEYAMDLAVARLEKPVVVVAHGATMGGGLGIAAGADEVLATDSTIMAMPEGRIGFFPDVGATGWLFEKCPPGYPEFLALTGLPVQGGECVRLGLATHWIPQDRITEALQALEAAPMQGNRQDAAQSLCRALTPLAKVPPPPDPEKDEWVKEHFQNKKTLREIRDSLAACSQRLDLCGDVFAAFSERSPTALALALRLLRRNQGRPLEEVFAMDLAAARAMARHPDFLEGIRARLLDKDDRPKWRPETRLEVPGL